MRNFNEVPVSILWGPSLRRGPTLKMFCMEGYLFYNSNANLWHDCISFIVSLTLFNDASDSWLFHEVNVSRSWWTLSCNSFVAFKALKTSAENMATFVFFNPVLVVVGFDIFFCRRGDRNFKSVLFMIQAGGEKRWYVYVPVNCCIKHTSWTIVLGYQR